jgi:hypothetical protein
MIEQGRRGIVGFMCVKVAFRHKGQGLKYAVGELVEGQLVEHQGKIVFEFIDQDKPEFIDPKKIDPANFDRSEGVYLRMSFNHDYWRPFKGDFEGKRQCYDKGSYVLGHLMDHDGGVYFLIDGEFVALHHFNDDVDTLEYEGGLGFEIEDIPRFFNALG